MFLFGKTPVDWWGAHKKKIIAAVIIAIVCTRSDIIFFVSDSIFLLYCHRVNISILLATRKRKHLLEKSINSLTRNANDATKIEFVFGIDDDDKESQYFINSTFRHLRKNILIFKPMGYANLHKYMNTLAAAATGKWLFIWNDDALMKTENWDEIIMSHGDEFKLLAPRDNHDGHPYAIFPIFPKDWFFLLDYVSNNPQNDRWLSEIAYALDIFERVDIECFHDRADLTGNNNG